MTIEVMVFMSDGIQPPEQGVNGRHPAGTGEGMAQRQAVPPVDTRFSDNGVHPDGAPTFFAHMVSRQDEVGEQTEVDSLIDRALRSATELLTYRRNGSGVEKDKSYPAKDIESAQLISPHVLEVRLKDGRILTIRPEMATLIFPKPFQSSTEPLKTNDGIEHVKPGK